jgi:hypothetical protein
MADGGDGSDGGGGDGGGAGEGGDVCELTSMGGMLAHINTSPPDRGLAYRARV